MDKKDWNLPKKISYIQRQRRSHNKMVGGGHSQSNQIPHPPGGRPTNWKIIILQRFSQRRVLSPMSGSSAWRSGIGRRSSQSTWLWIPAELDCRNSTGLGEIETPFLEGTRKVSCTPGPREKADTSQEPGPDLPAGLGGSPGEAEGGCGSLWGQGH